MTGASRGIGKAVARELALEGADVAVVARGREALEATAGEIAEESGRRVLPLIADMSDDASVQAMVQAAHEAFGRIDILVNSAASPGSALPPVPLAELTDDHVRADIEVKVLGYLRTARAVAPIMRAQGWGRIINVSGLGARRAGNTSGSMRNVAVAALTKNLANELGPDGINVTVVHPGGTRTERTAAMVAARVEAGVPEEEVERRLAEATRSVTSSTRARSRTSSPSSPRRSRSRSMVTRSRRAAARTQRSTTESRAGGAPTPGPLPRGKDQSPRSLQGPDRTPLR